MNKPISVVLIIIMSYLAGSMPARAQSGGPFTIQRSVIAGGGGSSTGGSFTLQGTIGQGVVGAMSDGTHDLAGGFWPNFHLCFVDLQDFAHFAGEWLFAGPGLPADLNHDGTVDLDDVVILADSWLAPCSIQWPL